MCDASLGDVYRDEVRKGERVPRIKVFVMGNGSYSLSNHKMDEFWSSHVKNVSDKHTRNGGGSDVRQQSHR